MPLSKTGQEVMANMAKEYGAKKGEQVFYATMNKNKTKSSWENKKRDAIKRIAEGGK